MFMSDRVLKDYSYFKIFGEKKSILIISLKYFIKRICNLNDWKNALIKLIISLIKMDMTNIEVIPQTYYRGKEFWLIKKKDNLKINKMPETNF